MKKNLTITLLSIYLIFNINTIVFATNSLNDSKNNFIKVSDSIKDLDVKISNLDNEISDIKIKIDSNEKEMNKFQNDIDMVNTKISTLENEIKENEEILSSRLREMYKTGNLSGINFIIYLFQSDGLGEIFSKIHAAKTIIEFDNEIIDKNNKLVDSLNESILSIKHKKNSLDKLNTQIKEDLAKLEYKQKELNTSKTNLLNEKQQIANEIKENEEMLVNHSISIINSSSSEISQLNDAIMNLKSLLPQLSTESVIESVQAAISKANRKIDDLKKPDVVIPPPSSTGQYKATYSMEATAYSGHTITAMGTKPVRDPNGISTVAVDPKVIPLGSKLYIPNYGYAIASDTGGVIKGNKIDLFMNSKEECYIFGRRTITVHLVAYPNEW